MIFRYHVIYVQFGVYPHSQLQHQLKGTTNVYSVVDGVIRKSQLAMIGKHYNTYIQSTTMINTICTRFNMNNYTHII